MTRASESSSQIEGELLAEVQQEMTRRTSVNLKAKKKREPTESDDLPAALCAMAILATLALLAGTGVMMALAYAPAADDAHASTAWMEMTTWGELARAMHWHAANLAILLSAAYIGYLLWRGLYRRGESGRWWRAGMVLGLCVAAGFTGQLLPYDQNALHGTLIRVSYIESVPVVGPALADWLTGGGELGTSALTRFFGLHVLVVPAAMLILLRWFWRDTRSQRLAAAQLAVPAVVVAVVVLAALVFKAPLGLAGTLAEPYPDARPEWYALPLYALLKVLPAGVMQLAALVGPPLIGGAVVVALPMIETATKDPPKLLWPMRIGLIVGAVFALVFAILPLIEDTSEDKGWFRTYHVSDLMLQMGSRNEALGNSAEPLARSPHNSARDMIWLYERIEGVYPEKIDDAGRQKWDAWARDGAKYARELLMAGTDAQQREARRKLREVCANCHDAHGEEDVALDPPPTMLGNAGGNGGAGMFFDREQVAKLKPTPLQSRSTNRVMDQGKFRLRDILAHAGVVQADTDRGKEQALVDLRNVADTIGGMYEANAGAYFEEAKWNQWVTELKAAIAKLESAADPAEVAKRAAEVGKTCEACHDGADDPDEPIEWRYSSLLQ